MTSQLKNGVGNWGPKYKTLRSACEVLVVRNTKGEQWTPNHKHIASRT